MGGVAKYAHCWSGWRQGHQLRCRGTVTVVRSTAAVIMHGAQFTREARGGEDRLLHVMPNKLVSHSK
jgi:hypothetical protein